jgi:multiple sugar transport system ATP-binding protein
MGEVRIEGLRKLFGSLEVIKGIDLTVADRELVVFVGPSGCGKSTLLRMIAGLEEVDYGTIRIAGRDVTENAPADRGVAMVFQNYALYPHMSAFDNMAYGLRRAGLARAEVDRRVRATADLLQIAELLPRRPKSMSGGQRQRVAIGRAIVREPEVFLFDEPLSNLDASLRVEMRNQIARLHGELQATMIFVTHDQVEAMTLADRIVVLNGGRVEQQGAPLDLYINPANRFVAGFLGSPKMNFLSVEVRDRVGGGITVAAEGLPPVTVPLAPDAEAPQGPVTLGLRPEHLSLDGGAVRLPARLRHVEHLGRETVLFADAAPLRCIESEGGHGSFTIQSPQPRDAVIGQAVSVGFDPASVHVFDAAGRTLSPRRPVPVSRQALWA